MSDVDASVQKQSTSGMAIAGLVLGIVALVSSWVPIINNFSFFVALVGALLALIGLVGVLRGKKLGKGLAIAAVAINVVAVAVVLATQSAYSAALDDATRGAEVVSTTDQTTQSQDASAATGSDAASTDATQQAEMPVGGAAQLDNGLTVSVDSVTPGLVNYDGSTVTGVQVTITNDAPEAQSFNAFDWKCEDANGVQTSYTIYSGAENELNSGSLATGGTITAMIYFDGDITKVLYFGSVFSNEPTAVWSVA